MSDRRAHLLRLALVEQRPAVVEFLSRHIQIPRSMSPARVHGAMAPFSLQHQG